MSNVTDARNFAKKKHAGQLRKNGKTTTFSHLKDVVKNKPETNIELGEITTSLMEVVKTTKKGTSTTYNRFKIRK